MPGEAPGSLTSSSSGNPSQTAAAGATLGRYLIIASLARLSDSGARVAFILLALDRTSSATFGGLLVAALMMPHLLAAPFVGALADRVRKRKLFYASALLLFGAVLALCAVLVGRVTPLIVLLLALIGGMVGPLLTGGLTGLLSDLVVPGGVDRAYRLDMVSYTVAGICGPALAAAIAGWLNAEVATLGLACGVGIAAMILLSLPVPNRDADLPASNEPLSRAFSQGMGIFLKDHSLRSVTIASCLGQLGVGAIPVAAALVATEYFSASTLGAFMSALAVGALAGSLAYARYPVGADKPERVVLACLAGTGLPFLLLAISSNRFILTLSLFAFAGIFSGPLGSSLFVIRDRQAPPEVHTQVFMTGAGLKITSAAGGAALGGIVAGVGASWLLAIIALFHLVAAATGAILIKGSR